VELVIEQEALADALMLPMRCISKKSPLPICTKVSLRAAGGVLTVVGTDLVRRGESAVKDVEILSPGECCVEASTFAAVARKMPKGPVTLRVEKYALTIKAGRTKSTLPTVPFEDFPRVNELERPSEGAWSSVAVEALRDVLAARYCMSTDEARAHMAGIHLSTSAGMVIAQASDGHRGARFESDDPDAKFGAFLLPLLALHDVLAIVEAAAGRVEVSCGSGVAWWRASTSAGALTLVHQLAENHFPPLDAIIAQATRNAPRATKIDREATASAVGRCKITTMEKSEGIVLTLEGDELRLRSDSPDRGTTQDAVQVIGTTEPTTEPIGMSATYLRETLDAHVTDEVDLNTGDGLAPVMVRSPGRLSLIMPQRG